MKKVKKLSVLILAIIMLFSLGGCMDEGSDYFDSGISSEAFSGVKVAYIADDQQANDTLIEYYEKFSLNILLELWGTYGLGIEAGEYSVVGGQVVAEGGHNTTVLIEQDVLPSDNSDIAPYYTNKNAIVSGVYKIMGPTAYTISWNLNGGYTPNNIEDDINFLDYATMHYQTVTRETFYSVLNLTPAQKTAYDVIDYATATDELAAKIDHFGFLTLPESEVKDEQERVLENITDLFVSQGTTYVKTAENTFEPYTDPEHNNILLWDNYNKNEETLYKNYAETFDTIISAIMQNEDYFISPKIYVKDILLTSDGLPRLETKQYISYIYMPKTKVYFDYVSYVFQHLQVGDVLNVSANFNLCANINDAGDPTSLRNYVNFAFTEYAGTGEIESENMDTIDFEFKNYSQLNTYIKDGQLVLRTFVNNTPAEQATLVGANNDYNSHFKMTPNASGVGCKISYLDATTDFFELSFDITGTANHTFYVYEFASEYDF